MTDGDQDRPNHPAPSVEGTMVERGADGDVRKVTVSVTYWDQDAERTVDVPFRFGSQRDPDAVYLTSVKKSGNYLSPRDDLVPLLVAQRVLRDLDAVDVDSHPVSDALDDAEQEAARAFQDDG